MANSTTIKNITGLKATERRIIDCIADGFTNKEIARKLGLKPGTISNYVSYILHKTGLQHRTQIAIYYALKNSGCSDSEKDGTIETTDNFHELENAFIKAKRRYNETRQ
jgi:DNA-binding CsgD family transcriptional regulator